MEQPKIITIDLSESKYMKVIQEWRGDLEKALTKVPDEIVCCK